MFGASKGLHREINSPQSSSYYVTRQEEEELFVRILDVVAVTCLFSSKHIDIEHDS
jgi:hypothetical protein